MPKKVLIISGSPGTGKTTLAKKLIKKLEFGRLDLHDYYKQISTGYNRSKRCYDVDVKKLEFLVKEKIKEMEKEDKEIKKKNKVVKRDDQRIKSKKETGKTNGLIIDSHIAHLLPKKLVDLCIILTCSDLKKLRGRLKRRKYSKKKIRENLDAEIFQVCLTEARERKHKVLVFDVSKKVDWSKIIRKIKSYLNSK